MAAYVKKADGDVIRIERLANSIRASLEGPGFSDAHGRQLELLATDDMAQATILDRLRIMGVALSAGREWCPTEMLELLRDQGLLHPKAQKLRHYTPIPAVTALHLSRHGSLQVELNGYQSPFDNKESLTPIFIDSIRDIQICSITMSLTHSIRALRYQKGLCTSQLFQSLSIIGLELHQKIAIDKWNCSPTRII
ncbi:hypothetical protein RXP19_25575 [Pseudomonas aeruginosa]|nr:hypothetical protein [Pseudomonas aeruginosa]MEB5096775.1 hypothetical protein [Pseudomonas aeruginosa]MEB5108745.1 hypothetical protein [Pseudomonas aeruginosa]MEB5160721.1 hypothetical protein [Pseudomonas aeruginosa]MEB5172652.1 hypothetical protein [Pseudomonas aeruginosa]